MVHKKWPHFSGLTEKGIMSELASEYVLPQRILELGQKLAMMTVNGVLQY